MFMYSPACTPRVFPRRARRALSAAVGIAAAFVLMLLASSSLLRAQCGPEPHNFCEDTCCHTDVLLLNTGYDHAANHVYEDDSRDEYWTIVADRPRSSGVVKAADNWADPFPNSKWIRDPAENNPDRTTFEKCFCVCDSTKLTFTLNILATGKVTIYVDNQVVRDVPIKDPKTPVSVSFTITVGPGRHCIEFEVEGGGETGIDVQGTVEGSGLLKYNCCAAAPVIEDPCESNHETFGTDDSWTIISEPAGCPNGTPRCADLITTQWWPGTWGFPIAGSSWIGDNGNGFSCPGCVFLGNPPDEYIYRKSFCVARAGTFIITITGMADDAGLVDLNGVTLTPVGGGFNRLAPATETYIVGLEEGCNCLDIRVLDLGCGITGLDAFVDIQGGYLLRPECCDCGVCTQTRNQRGPDDGDGAALGVHSPHDATAAARPMLVSIPNPTTGATTVHYILDQEATAHVELYNAAGQRVMVVDEGVRAKGAHAVPLATDGLAKGAYHLRLVYGTHTLTVPVTVQ